MTVSTTESRIGYNGNGATTVFAFPYRFLTNTDLVVTLVRADTTQVVQTLNTDYTVTGAGDDAGGTVTMAVAPATGQQLVIVRAVPLTQETDYISGDPFPAESHERALDKLTMISQRLENLISRSIRLSDADLLVTSTILPAPSPGSSLIWNLTGTGLVNGVSSGSFVGLSPYMEVVLGSVDAAEARTNLGAASAATLTTLDAEVVKLTGDQTIDDVKTFIISPVIPDGAAAQNPVSKAQLDAAVAPATLAPTLSDDMGADVPTTSGTSHMVSGIPSWALCVHIDLMGISVSGTDNFGFQVGNSGGFVTSGYAGGVSGGTNAVAFSNAFTTMQSNAPAGVWEGQITLRRARATDTTWSYAAIANRSDGPSVTHLGAGSVTISNLDRVRIAMLSGSSTFDAGSFRVRAGI